MPKLQLSKKYRERCQNTENTVKMSKYRANIKEQSNRDLCSINKKTTNSLPNVYFESNGSKNNYLFYISVPGYRPGT